MALAAAPLSRSQQKRAAVLQAALRSFREDGYHLTSMDRVAERARVSKRTVYNHFSSKDALFDEVVGGLWGRLLAAPGQAPAAPDAPVRDRLVGLLQGLLEVLLEPDLIGLFRLILAESERVPALMRALRLERDPLELLGIAPLLRDESARGRLQIQRIDLAAMQLWGLTINGLFWPRVLGFPVPAQSAALIVAEGVDIFLGRYARSARGKRKTGAVP